MTGPGTADLILTAAEAWAGAGLVVAVAFLGLGLDRVTPQAAGSWPFRLLLVPGLVLLWPLVLWRWARLFRGETDEGSLAGRAAVPVWAGLAILLPLLLTAAFALRGAAPAGPLAERLTAGEAGQ